MSIIQFRVIEKSYVNFMFLSIFNIPRLLLYLSSIQINALRTFPLGTIERNDISF